MTERFSLNKIAIRHFKAVRQSGEVELTPLTVFIGNNGSGKSSLIEGLEAYSDIVVKGLDDAFERWLGLGHTWNKAVLHRRRSTKDRGDAYDNPISMHLKGHWGRGAFNSLLEVAPEVEGGQARIEKEFLKLPTGRLYRRDYTGRAESFNDETLERVRKVAPAESASPQDWIEHVSELAVSPPQSRRHGETEPHTQHGIVPRAGTRWVQHRAVPALASRCQRRRV